MIKKEEIFTNSITMSIFRLYILKKTYLNASIIINKESLLSGKTQENLKLNFVPMALFLVSD